MEGTSRKKTWPDDKRWLRARSAKPVTVKLWAQNYMDSILKTVLIGNIATPLSDSRVRREASTVLPFREAQGHDLSTFEPPSSSCSPRPKAATTAPIVERPGRPGSVMLLMNSSICSEPRRARSATTFWIHFVIVCLASMVSGLCRDATAQTFQFVLLSGRASRCRRYNMTTPKAQTSPGKPRPAFESSKNSGGTYQGVPATCMAVAGVWMSSLLSPKSMRTAPRAELKRIFPGLMSLCVMPFLWTKARGHGFQRSGLERTCHIPFASADYYMLFCGPWLQHVASCPSRFASICESRWTWNCGLH